MTHQGVSLLLEEVNVLSIKLISETHYGNVIRRTYSCLCGRGVIEEEQDYTPGHRDGIAFLKCKYCEQRYKIDFGTSQIHWKVAPIKELTVKEDNMNNLAFRTFCVLREVFFDNDGNPIRFNLREKHNTQDDPFDEYIAQTLDHELMSSGIRCQKSSGPLISPDMAIYRVGLNTRSETSIGNPDNIIGIEVKKLERGGNGKIARATGMDYNSTPPCGRIRIYSATDEQLIIKGYYLFACLEMTADGSYFVSAMCLCDGSILNDDFELYMQITGSREKGINIGTYGDGANRNRPMLIFSNPLGSPLLDRKISLISGLDLGCTVGNIGLAWRFVRKDAKQVDHVFYTYLDSRDIGVDHRVTDVHEPFPVPQNRVSETQGRGKFRLTI